MHARLRDPAFSKKPETAAAAERGLPHGFDGQVLLAIRKLDESAYGPDIARALERDAGKSISRGALYTTLDRLEKKGLVRWRIEDATAGRGGFPRRRFETTGAPTAEATR